MNHPYEIGQTSETGHRGPRTPLHEMKSVREIDLTPVTYPGKDGRPYYGRPHDGKPYWNCDRDWREEFIYQVLVDRFHDGKPRSCPRGRVERSRGSGTPEQLKTFCHGNLKGISEHLDYIRDLGCTALWITPIYENTPKQDAYHGYHAMNYLAIDPRFGTPDDFRELIDEAHGLEMRVFLDIVLNHSGDTWYYHGSKNSPPPPYRDGRAYLFGDWRYDGYPRPLELRNPEYYHRMGERKGNADLCGDFLGGLKDFRNDETREGLELQEIMIKIHCAWIQEYDLDGFRLDAVRHIPPMAVSRFCTAVREYTQLLGKRRFLMFGEMAGKDDRECDRYIGPNHPILTDDSRIYFGLDSVLDFPLHTKFHFSEVIKGNGSPSDLVQRYEGMRENDLRRGVLGHHLVTFLDSHDQCHQEGFKERFAANAHDEQVIAAVGFLLCALGTPCLYYGTEQGFSGHTGNEDYADRIIREAMFDLDRGDLDYFNPDCGIYRGISQIARIHREFPALRFGRMCFRETSEGGKHFALPEQNPCTLAFSRILSGQEVLIAYNTSTEQKRHDYVRVGNRPPETSCRMRFLYSGKGTIPVDWSDISGDHFLSVRLELEPMQFVILGKEIDAGGESEPRAEAGGL